MPSWELFREQEAAYRDAVLPPDVTARISIEAGCTQGWREWIGDRGIAIGIDRFGASAPAAELFDHFGFDVPAIVAAALRLLED